MLLRRLWVPAIFLAFLDLLPATAFCENSSEASEPLEEAPLPRLDFQFDEPRMSLGFRGGWAFNRSKGEIYDFLTDELTLSKSDFDAPAFAVDFSWRLISWLDVVFGFEYSRRKQNSEDRGFKDKFTGRPVVQDTRLTQVPLTLSLKIYPIGRGEQVGQYAWIRKAVVPYIGGGIGGTWYELKQTGEFVDKGKPELGDEFIFSDVLISDGWAFAQHAFVGLDIKLTRSFGLILEGRYYWADADLQEDFVEFNPIDLDGARAMIGFNWKF
jgi:opacity protein-like surface antigen